MENRLHPRIPVNPLVHARFRLGSKDCKGIRIANLGTEGCCIQVPSVLAGAFLETPSLDDWRLFCPDLPSAKVKARVVWARGQSGVEGAPLQAGIRFTNVPASFARALDEYVTYVAKTGIPPIDYTGMPA